MIPLFGPGWGNYALHGIVEVRVPEPVALTPQTPGWWLLLSGLLLGAAWILWQRRQRWLHNRYRREAQKALESIRRSVDAGDESALRELAPLLRATAMAAGERTALASLRGEAWSDALASMAPNLPPLPLDTLDELAYGSLQDASKLDIRALMASLDTWIDEHGEASA